MRRCIIEDISGTLPECAIDIESNKNDTVDNVVIDNVTIRNCASGIAAYGKASNSRIGLVTVKNCSLRQINKIVMSYSYSDSIFVNRCKIYGNNDEIRITCNKVKNATFTRNYVAVEEGTMKSLKKIIANGKSQKTLVAKECNNLQVKYK